MVRVVDVKVKKNIIIRFWDSTSEWGVWKFLEEKQTQSNVNYNGHHGAFTLVGDVKLKEPIFVVGVVGGVTSLLRFKVCIFLSRLPSFSEINLLTRNVESVNITKIKLSHINNVFLSCRTRVSRVSKAACCCSVYL